MALVTIKPTRIDTAIAYAIAAHTDDDVENAAEALTWGADETCAARAGGGRLALRSAPQAAAGAARKSHSDGFAGDDRATSYPEIRVRPDQPGPAHNCRPSAWRSLFRAGPRCLSIRSCRPHGGAGVRSRPAPAGAAPRSSLHRSRAFADPDHVACALGERRRCGFCAWCRGRPDLASLDIDKTAGAPELKRRDGVRRTRPHWTPSHHEQLSAASLAPAVASRFSDRYRLWENFLWVDGMPRPVLDRGVPSVTL